MLKKVKVKLLHTLVGQVVFKKKLFPRFPIVKNGVPEELPNPQRICIYNGNKLKQFSHLLKMINITLKDNSRFQSWIDTGIVFPCFNRVVDNIPPNYQLILDYSLEELLNICCPSTIIGHANRIVLDNVQRYIKRIISTIEEKLTVTQDYSLSKTLQYFKRMLDSPAESLEEAFQRILFWSSLFWQTKHRLVGLGRLDVLLDRYNDSLPKEEMESIVIDFYDEIHRYYNYKSKSVSQGDTGQIIILGGLNQDGTYFHNCFTKVFIEALNKHKLPDPKLLLRISQNMPEDILRLALRTIFGGAGCPLLSNDDVVIPALLSFGYKTEDAYNYVTSACWEPVAYGKSLENNNMFDINFGRAITDLYMDESFEAVKDFSELKTIFFGKVSLQIDECYHKLDSVKWEPDPLMTLFTEGCLENNNDVAQGGATYNDYGILTVGLGNAINSLMNLKKHVFAEPEYNLAEIKQAMIDNYQNHDDMLSVFKEVDYYGRDDLEIISLTKEIMTFLSNKLKTYKNCFGGSVKFGLSSPDYLLYGKKTRATLDGRRTGEPLTVHISNQNGIAYTELINFASELEYDGNQSNGNVVDFFVSPKLANESFEAFVRLIQIGIQSGFFQMQMNVVDSATLIAAKEHPEQFPDLIVRVWGFSAYFNDLPDEYKNLMIQRALQNELKI